MKLQLSNAPCSWGVEFADNPSNPSWETVLQEISLAGYKATELGPLGYLPTDTGVLAAKLDENGLGLIAGTIFKHLHKAEKRAEILEYTEATCKLLKAQNAQYMVVIDHVSSPRTDQAGQVETAYRLPDEEWFEMMKTITELSLICREYDIVPVIHPHAGTFIEYRDEIDRAMQDLDSDLVKLCVDTGHSKYAGINPAELIEAYQDRVAYIHFKDIDEMVLAHTVENHVDFYKAIGNGVFCPLGQGCVDFSAVRNTLEKINYTGWITVEQDVDPTKNNSSLENAQESLRFINQHFTN
ncbi:TIM barrel protein [Neptunomonas phycophila]|jgi:inosose dehydratase|uniref:TIM barrel protein n=1 Tax=Neptunomonas phycophila TaxID=1572645 RepID=A0AAW7XFJ0_9GAMM|nr:MULTISPECIES: TIM barrel protein [Neptunomonas]MBT3146338.1 sugar phosphate isomerase/epimerase [Neptunomonas phycophila]MDN2659490.1 TIM barrel protein [Neptunomonas sp. CHC150]MDO6452029.1 TIM barrel protein [Neptunomonas phycophila]MDO6466585.1 TIM barrel protein [Neptunomonas phycophila]MDP2521002.1 TIM barrel protein [Neptunomonas phycophila]